MPVLMETARKMIAAPGRPELRFILALPQGTGDVGPNFKEPVSGLSIQVLEGQTWDVLASADLALAASGTVTIEATLLGTPMITFYRLSRMSWWMGRHLVKVPFLSMVNLVADKHVVPELIQDDFTAERTAQEALSLLGDEAARDRMKRDLRVVAEELSTPQDPMEVAASIVEEHLKEEMVHA